MSECWNDVPKLDAGAGFSKMSKDSNDGQLSSCAESASVRT